MKLSRSHVMHERIFTRFSQAMKSELDIYPTPPIPENFFSDLKDMGAFGITSIPEICDYLNISLMNLCLLLSRIPGAIEAYRKARVEFKMEVTKRIFSLTDLEITEKTVPVILKAAEFLSHNITRCSLESDKLQIQKKLTKEQNRISRAVLRQGQERLALCKQESFIKLIIDKDEETLRKIQGYLDKTTNV